MTTIKRLTCALAFTCFTLLATAQAQTPQMATVNITPDPDRVHISAVGEVFEMRIEVSDESGDVVFQSGAVTGSALDWKMQDAQGERIAPGTYLVTVTFRNGAGKLRRRVEQVTVNEAEKPTAKATNAPEAVQATVTTTTPTTGGKIPKFAGTAANAVSLTNSVITESGGNIGIGAAPRAGIKLTVSGGPALITVGTNKEVQFGSPNTEVGMSFKHPGAPNTINRADIRFNGNALTLAAGIGVGIPPSTNGIVITTMGRVGVGGYPSNARLESHDAGRAIYAQSDDGYAVQASTDNGYAVFGAASAGGTGFAGYFAGKVQITGPCYGCDAASDRNLKANFSAVNPHTILDRLASIPIQTWNYKSEPESVRHIGAMAQDFRAAFQFGKDDKTLSTVDAQGVTMAAIQGLYQQNLELKNEVQHLRAQVTQQRAQLNQVKRAIKRPRTRKH